MPFACTTAAKKPRNEKAIIVEPKLGPGEYFNFKDFFRPEAVRFQPPAHKSKFDKMATRFEE